MEKLRLRLKNNRVILYTIIFALFIKLFLFVFTVTFYPPGKFQADSSDYINTGKMIVSQGAFAQNNNGALTFESRRTPGYPLFLGVLVGILKMPLAGIVFFQILLTIAAAFITYQAALEIDGKIAFLSGLIVLYSPIITINSLQILTETLYLFLLSVFMFLFMRYLKTKSIKLVIWPAVLLALATYVRPVSYYLPVAVAIFIIFANIADKFWRAFLHALIFLFITYFLLGIWQVRNYQHFHQYIFTHFQNIISYHSPLHRYIKEYNPFNKGLATIPFYIDLISRSFISLMTEPGSLKYFHCRALTIAGKIFGYAFVIFWWTGFLIGLTRIKKNIYYQFTFIVILYFILVTIAASGLSSSERYRAPMVPFIAIISAAGWIELKKRRLVA